MKKTSRLSLIAICSMLTLQVAAVETETLFPLDTQQTKTWQETAQDDTPETVIETTESGVVEESVLDAMVQTVLGGLYSNAEAYWTNDQQGLRLHKIAYPEITSQSMGSASFQMSFVPPISVLSSSVDPVDDPITSTGNVRYEITFTPNEHATILRFTQDNYAATDLSRSWSYRSSAQLSGRERVTLPLAVEGEQDLCSTRVDWEIVINGSIIGQGGLEVRLNAKNWLSEAVGKIKTQESVLVKLGSDEMSRSVVREMSSITSEGRVQSLNTIEGQTSETQQPVNLGWSLIALRVDQEQGLSQMINGMTASCSNIDQVILHQPEAVSAGQAEWMSIEGGEQATETLGGVVAKVDDNQTVRAVWVKSWKEEALGLSVDPSSLTVLEYLNLQNGWNLVPVGGATTISELIQTISASISENELIFERWFAYTQNQQWLGGELGRGGQHIDSEVVSGVWVKLLQ